MSFKIVAEIIPGEILLGESGGKAEVYGLSDSNIVNGLYTIETEFGPLLLDGETEIEIAEN